VVGLIIIFAGVVIDSLFSASWALDDGLLLAAAAVIALALLVTRGRGRSEAR
jgi:drug/metabolite transporter (DMT)-like permease